MMKTVLKLLLLSATTTALFAQSSPADRILGDWSTPNQESTIEIVKCGDSFCGSIKFMQKPANDTHNPDSSLRNRPLIGAQILKGFQYSATNTWTGGALYAPARGKTVNADLVLSSPDTLDIKAKAGIMSKTVTWTRAK